MQAASRARSLREVVSGGRGPGRYRRASATCAGWIDGRAFRGPRSSARRGGRAGSARAERVSRSTARVEERRRLGRRLQGRPREAARAGPRSSRRGVAGPGRLPRPRAATTRARTARGRLAVALRAEVGRGERRHLDVQVDPVEERPGDLPAVARHVARRARAGVPRVSAEAARARVHRADEEEAGREGARPGGARDGDDAVLERLAQRLERVAPELGQLVEEEDAEVGERELARARVGSAARERRRRRAVVRGAERALREEPASRREGGPRRSRSGSPRGSPRAREAAGVREAAARASSCRSPAGRTSGGCARPRRRSRARGARRPGRARPRGPARIPGAAPADGGRRDAREDSRARGGGRSPRRGAARRRRRGRRRRRPPRRSPAGTRSAPLLPARRLGDRRGRPARGRSVAVEGQLADERHLRERLRGHVAVRGEDRERDGEVERRPGLREVGRREIHDDVLRREREADVPERRADALAALLHGRVGEADDRQAGKARADRGLDDDRAARRGRRRPPSTRGRRSSSRLQFSAASERIERLPGLERLRRADAVLALDLVHAHAVLRGDREERVARLDGVADDARPAGLACGRGCRGARGCVDEPFRGNRDGGGSGLGLRARPSWAGPT